jgi:excisionase family DNA binding protein
VARTSTHAAGATLSPDELCTVEFASSRLKLHQKTVLRLIRSGRLKGTKIGKAYRIRRRDLETFAGAPPAEAVAAPAAWVTSIVDVPGVDSETAQKWARALPAALKGRERSDDPIRVDIVYERERSHLKIVIVGDAAETAKLLGLVQFLTKQLSA